MTWHAALVVALFGVVAVVGGGVLTVQVFRLVDRSGRRELPPMATASEQQASAAEGVDAGVDAGAHEAAGAGETSGANAVASDDILRGGAWIGSLERIAVYAALVGGWKEAITMVLALKALGRYPELRNGENPAVAERFIIGTFVSVLWASGCALLALWLR